MDRPLAAGAFHGERRSLSIGRSGWRESVREQQSGFALGVRGKEEEAGMHRLTGDGTDRKRLSVWRPRRAVDDRLHPAQQMAVASIPIHYIKLDRVMGRKFDLFLISRYHLQRGIMDKKHALCVGRPNRIVAMAVVRQRSDIPSIGVHRADIFDWPGTFSVRSVDEDNGSRSRWLPQCCEESKREAHEDPPERGYDGLTLSRPSKFPVRCIRVDSYAR